MSTLDTHTHTHFHESQSSSDRHFLLFGPRIVLSFFLSSVLSSLDLLPLLTIRPSSPLAPQPAWHPLLNTGPQQSCPSPPPPTPPSAPSTPVPLAFSSLSLYCVQILLKQSFLSLLLRPTLPYTHFLLPSPASPPPHTHTNTRKHTHRASYTRDKAESKQNNLLKELLIITFSNRNYFCLILPVFFINCITIKVKDEIMGLFFSQIEF